MLGLDQPAHSSKSQITENLIIETRIFSKKTLLHCSQKSKKVNFHTSFWEK